MKRKNKIIIFLAIIYSIFTIIGTNLLLTNSFNLIKRYFLINIIFFGIFIKIYYFIIYKLFNFFDKTTYKSTYKTNNKFLIFFDKNPFLCSFIFIIIFWLIYIIAFFPGILSPDPSYQILQYFNIKNKYSSYVNLIDPKIIITNHHPVIHTLLIGTCVKIGITLFHSTNIGLFIYSIIQTLILSLTLSYTIKFMKDININLKYRFLVLLIYCLIPVFPMYAMSIVKDVIYSSLIVIYIISIFNIMTNRNKLTKKDILLEILLSITICLFRNNGIFLVILSFPFLIITNKKIATKIIFISIIVLSFDIFYNKSILPYFKITNTSIREVLSIPFQQTARYVSKNYKHIPKNERKSIDKILCYKKIKKLYNPEIADPIKNRFNKNASSKDLHNYFNTWKKELFKDPITYLEATINNTYGYFYPLKINWYLYYNYFDLINKYGFNYHYNKLNKLRHIIICIGTYNVFIPILNFIINIGFNTWILLFMTLYLIYRKKYKEIVIFCPSIVTLLICIASPANTYFRYSLPNIFAMPTLISMFYYIIKHNSQYNKSSLK